MYILFSDFDQQSEDCFHGATKQESNLLNENNDLQGISFDNIYEEFNYSSTDNLLNTNFITENTTAPIETEAAKYAAVIEEQFEIANRLKDYAVVATENIPLQLSYNIGTENIENVKEGETLIDNTRVELEENSIITEFENAGIDLCDIDNTRHFGFNSIYNPNENVKVNNAKVKIIDVQHIIPWNASINSNTKALPNTESISLEKQIYTPEALQMSLACDEEIPSAWEDVVNYASNAGQTNVFKENMNENPLTAVPTAIQSYINLPSVPNTASVNAKSDVDANRNFKNESTVMHTKSVINDVNLLKNLTAEADICSCQNCKCSPLSSCQNCLGIEDCCKTNNQQITLDLPRQPKSYSCSTATNVATNTTSSSFENPVQPSCCNTSPVISSTYSSNISVQSSSCTNTSNPAANCSSNTPIQSSCCTSNSPSQVSQKPDSTSGCWGTNTDIPLVANSLLSSFGANLKSPLKNRCSGVSSAIQLIKASNPNCNKRGDDCCVVICLKTMEQLRQMLTLASGCNNFQSFTLGCVPNDLCGVPK